MARQKMERWVREYFRCWKEKDTSGLRKLFTESAVYRSGPFREPLAGTDAIGAYWRRATRSQRGLEIRVGLPLCDRNHAAVEWWATWKEGKDSITLPGCLVLRFAPDGRCQELREYWDYRSETLEPPPGWGR